MINVSRSDWKFDINVFEDYMMIEAVNTITYNKLYSGTIWNVTWYERIRGLTMVSKLCNALNQMFTEIDKFDNNFSAAEFVANHYKYLNIKVH